MRKVLFLFYALVMAVVPFAISCESGEIDPNNPPKLVLDVYELNIDGGGGDIPLFYGLKNPVKGGEFEIVSAVDWVSLKEVTQTTIVLHIEPSNVDEERFASVSIKYPGLESAVRVNILQDKQLLNKYRFEVFDVTHSGCKVKYMPTDKNMPYMANIIDAEYFKQSGVTDMNVFIETEMSNYRAIAERNKMTLEELMGRVSPQLIYTGDAVREFTGMKHGSTYVAYSYGITFHGNTYTVTAPMHQTRVEVPMPNMYNVSFGISSQMSGNMATIIIDPKGWKGHYCVQIAYEGSLLYIEPGINITDGYVKSVASNFYDQARNALSNGASVEQFLRSACYQDKKQLNVSLESGKLYMVIVFAVESTDGAIPVLRSMPSIHYL